MEKRYSAFWINYCAGLVQLDARFLKKDELYYEPDTKVQREDYFGAVTAGSGGKVYTKAVNYDGDESTSNLSRVLDRQ